MVAKGMNTFAAPPDIQIPSSQWHKYFTDIYREDDHTNLSTQLCELNVPMLHLLPEWEPVSTDEINDLISSISNNKAPGPDMLPGELFKSFPEWWSAFLAKVFSFINHSGEIPPDWHDSIVIPIHKKGSKSDPKNFRPISLLCVVAKLYTKFLLQKLETWASENSAIAEEQAGFQRGKSTLDHSFVIHHLILKYSQVGKKKLYAAFVDLSSAFDSINRLRLWKKLSATNIDRRLLFLLMKLHSNTNLRVRLGPNGLLSEEIPTDKGVRQGCILAPFLFNFYINNIVSDLQGPEFFPPSILDIKLPILLYADDIVLFSITPIGLRRLLAKLSSFCAHEKLTINHNKTKVVIFGNQRKKHIWRIEDSLIEQISAFRYLGILFNSRLKWSPHLKSTKLKAAHSAHQLLHFVRSKGGNLVPPAIEVFAKKLIPQITFGSEIWGYTNISSLEVTQNTFIRSLLSVPRHTPVSLLRAEVGLIPLIAICHSALILYWYKVSLMKDTRLPKICLKEQLANPSLKSWVNFVKPIFDKYDIDTNSLPSFLSNSVKVRIKDKIRLFYMRQDLCIIASSPYSSWIPLYKLTFVSESYLTMLTVPALRKAFTALRFQSMPSMVIEGRLETTPYLLRTCPCHLGEVEDIAHYLLRCPFYDSPRSQFLAKFLTFLQDRPTLAQVCWLLADIDTDVSLNVANFALAAINIRAYLLPTKPMHIA